MQWRLIVTVTLTFSANLNSGSGSKTRNFTADQYSTVILDCYFSSYEESADWVFFDQYDDHPLFVSGHKQPQEHVKFNINEGSGFTNLTLLNVSFVNNGRYECRAGWNVAGRPKQNFELHVNDIDECSTWNNTCGANAICTNTEGSFYCSCRSGFTGEGSTCEDLNECDNSTACEVNAFCSNTIGSFKCTCNQGYIELQPVGGCTELTNVHAIVGEDVPLSCQSTAWVVWMFVEFPGALTGTYLYLNGTTIAKNVFLGNSQPFNGKYDIVLLNAQFNQSGYYVCFAKAVGTNRGYHLNITDVDECQSSPCGDNATCSNTPGSYVCTCPKDSIHFRFVRGCIFIQELHVETGKSLLQRPECRNQSSKDPIFWKYMADDSLPGVNLTVINQTVNESAKKFGNHGMLVDDDGSLTLNDVKPNEAGFYLCINALDGTMHGYFLNVTAAGSLWTFEAGIILAVVLGVVIIITVIVLLLRVRKRVAMVVLGYFIVAFRFFVGITPTKPDTTTLRVSLFRHCWGALLNCLTVYSICARTFSKPKLTVLPMTLPTS